MQIKAFNVGMLSTNCYVVSCPETREAIIVDPGFEAPYEAEQVIRYVDAHALKVKFIVNTHGHADHIGGLITVLETFPVREVIDPAVVHTTKTFEDYLTLIDQKNIKFTAGRAGNQDLGDGITMTLLHPVEPSSAHLNDASVVTKVEYNQVSFLFTGDAEAASERDMLERGEQLRSTVLKVGHHGSRTSTTPAFLRAVSPAVAVIMAGAGNRYGHPHPETISKLGAAGVDVYRTDLQGTIVVMSDGEGFEVRTEKKAEVKPKVETTEGLFVGSIRSDKYHFPHCRYAKTIKPENKTWFSSVAEAKAAGYVPCGACKPPK